MSHTSIRFAVVGLGRIGIQHINACLSTEGLELAAVCDTDESRFPRVRELSSAKCYSSYETLLKEGEFDWLVIGTPSHLHMDMTLAGLQAGYHVMVEKPMANDVRQVERMIETAKQCGKYLTVNQSLRYQEDFRRIQQILESGRIGTPYNIYQAAVGFTERTDWQIWRKNNGGAVANLGVHLIDNIVQLSHSTPKEVFARFYRIQDQGDAEDSFSITILFEDGSTALVENLKSTRGKALWNISGTLGTIHVADHASPVVELLVRMQDKTEQTETIDFRTEAGDKLGRHYKDFARKLLKNEAPPITPESVLLQMKVIDAARKSHETGRSVSLLS
ncbi:MAG: Gfo/Idh/MocA family oxidoreductase [Phycisphaerae bacterium]|nr:Gfo/Idh/MocA family oxidoreductase [Phycisphaerae bacterium]